jgi:E3 ubiquitin-protein ligase UBR3
VQLQLELAESDLYIILLFFQNDEMQVSFHLPLHRYFSVFLYQAVRNQGLTLEDLLPPPSELSTMIHHPLRVQAAFYEIITGLWVRNGLQIKGQAMTYVQCHFCNSMVDADLFLLQVAMTNLPYGEFTATVLEKYVSLRLIYFICFTIQRIIGGGV